MAAKTYYVGTPSLVKRADNIDTGSTTWVDLTGNFAGEFGDLHELRDVMTDPLDSNKVFVTGRAMAGFSFRGIAYSTDAGVTWATPTFTPALTAELSTVDPFYFYEVWTVSTSVIYACASNGVVAKSVNGGLDFDLVTKLAPPFLAQPDVYSIHFISPTVGIVGLGSYIYKTVDGGTTWQQLSGAIIGGVGNIYGVYLHDDQQTIIGLGESTIVKSDDGGVTFSTVFTWGNMSARNGRHLTWYKNSLGLPTFWGTGNNNQIVTSIPTSVATIGSTWTTLQSYKGTSTFDYKAAHFYTATNGLWAHSPACRISTITGATTIISDDSNASGEVFTAIEAIWTDFTPTGCYLLTDCTDDTNTLLTTSDLSLYLGSIITASIDEQVSNTCWLVSTGGDCNSTVIVSDVILYGDCSECEERCYRLTNCENSDDYLIVYAAYEDYLYKAVNLESCPEKCYFVTRSNCAGAQPLTDLILTEYTTCDECLLVPPSYELKSRRVRPGYYTPGCPPKYTEEVYCTFSEALYDEMAKDRYGIDICCDINLDKWEIKKERLDLDSIYDEDMCTYTIAPCGEPCNVTANLSVYTLLPYVDNTPEPDCVDPEPDPSVNTTFE